MDWRSNLRRSQSLRGVSSSCDKPSWTEAGPRDKKTSVSQLVSRYQTTLEVSTSTEAGSLNDGESKPKQVLKEVTASLLQSKDTQLEYLMKRNSERVLSRAKTNLSRSKSMGSLQNSTGSIEALKALFESKAATQNKVKSNFTNSTPAHKAAHTPVINGEVEEVKNAAEEPKRQISADADVTDAKTTAKVDRVTRQVVNHIQKERRKTIGGIDFEKIAAFETDEKRRSVADFRDSSFIHDKGKLCVSVKAMSALYLSKVGPKGTNPGLSKPVQNHSSEMEKRPKLTKFQLPCREMCSACLNPVYPMEKIAADKYVFHKTCFCCKQCKKKLSMHNFAPLYGEFYCISHYQQLFRRKGNYDEGFGHTQHKNRWLLRNSSHVDQDESEA